MRRLVAVIIAPLLIVAAPLSTGCDDPTAGWAAPGGAGPRIKWDLAHKPLPEIPFPNDVATIADPTSPTGRRINVSLIAPTGTERHVRDKLSRFVGFSTFAPITVGFEAPIDTANVRRRHKENNNPADDTVYLIDLESGERVPLDLGRGNYPIALEEPDAFFKLKNAADDLRPWDPRRDSSNFVVETADEDVNRNGVLDWGEDTDNDGVLDRPNLFPDRPKSVDAERAKYDYLVDFYEYETNTLEIRPLVALRPKRRYAVVVAGRLVDAEGRSVRSPFPTIAHVQQTADLADLERLVAGDDVKLHVGKKGPDDLDYVAFAWTFTTQAIGDELLAVRKGLYGEGPLAALAADPRFAPKLILDRIHSETTTNGEWFWDKGDFWRVDRESVRRLIRAGGPLLFGGLPRAESQNLVKNFEYVESMIIGRFFTPDFLCYRKNEWEVNPYRPKLQEFVRAYERENNISTPCPPPYYSCPDTWLAGLNRITDYIRPQTACAGGYAQAFSFEPVDLDDEYIHVDLDRGTYEACPDEVPIIMTVPIETADRKQPFPLAIYYHGYTLTRLESLSYAAYLAKLGIASIGIDAPGHGNPFGPETVGQLAFLLDTKDFIAKPAAEALARHRARGLLRNGREDDTGGDYWTSDSFHTREVVKQTVIDTMQLIRIFRSFDGAKTWRDHDPEMGPQYDHPDNPAGDFDGNGVPDVGGPNAEYYIWGQSLGGIIAGIAPAVEPALTAAVPVSGGGGLADIAVRSVQGGVKEAVQLKVMGPAIVIEPEARGDGASIDPATQVMVSWLAANYYYADVLPIAPLTAQPGDRVRVRNLTSGTERDGLVPADKRLMIPIQCDARDKVVIEVIPNGTAAPDPLRTVATWTYPTRYQGRFYCEGEPLEAPAQGWAFKRNSPDLRRLLGVSQMILDDADPVNYARHMFLEPLVNGRDGKPHKTHTLVVNTAGDMNVPINTGMAFSRSAGVLDYDGKAPLCPGVSGPDTIARYGMSGNDMLIGNYVMEGLEKLGRFTARDIFAADGPDGKKPVIDSIFDPDNLDNSTDGYDASSPAVPLRFTRKTLSNADLAAGCDGAAATGESGMRIPYIWPGGAHTFEWQGRVNAKFVIQRYMGNLVAYYLRTKQIRDDKCLLDPDVCGLVGEAPK